MGGCDRTLELISLGLDGALDDGERRELEAHLDACAACGSLARELERLHTAMAELEEEVPEGFHEAVMDRVRAEKKMAALPQRRRGNVKKWVSMAAVFAVVLVGAGTLRGYLGGAGGGEAAPKTAVRAAPAQDAPMPEPYAAAAETGEPGEGAAAPRVQSNGTVAPALETRGVTNDGQAGRTEDAGSRAPTGEEREALAANCAAWVGENGLDKVDTGLVSIAPVTQADLEAVACDGAARERLGMDDWRVTVGDAAGQDHVGLICDGETLEVLGYFLLIL